MNWLKEFWICNKLGIAVLSKDAEAIKKIKTEYNAAEVASKNNVKPIKVESIGSQTDTHV